MYPGKETPVRLKCSDSGSRRVLVDEGHLPREHVNGRIGKIKGVSKRTGVKVESESEGTKRKM